ncbi:TonB-dependent receptor [uncultured Pseudacidovorax sp.]|uniref:TonB-dependent receptor domain-containing protein n=1 Tax=uncultured Pseudacidovorax sp. TaxID=679313 RepID=UPI00345C9B31
MVMATAQAGVAGAQVSGAGQLPEVTVSTPGGPQPVFAVPGSVDRVEGADLRGNRLGVQLSEGLGAVPGLQIRDRQNFAQDLQLSIRGFGARSTFGVRGVRLYVDGIPATLPDGQGQTSNIDIASLERIDVLRGPFSALYGNSSGGVVQAFTAPGEAPASLSYSVAGGSNGTWRTGLVGSGKQGAVDWRLSASSYSTDGWRAHSAAQRDLANARVGIDLDQGGKLTLVFNRVTLDAQDPLGLTAQQFATAPRSADLATQYNTRKTVTQSQAGVVFEQPLGAQQSLRFMLYGGERGTTQYQAIPPSAQQNPRHAGGVIDLDRHYAGADLRWTGKFDLAGRPFELVAGLGYDSLREWRRGYENYVGGPAQPLLGVQGRLRRNERNEVFNVDPYAQATWRFAPDWSAEFGVRRSRVHFDSQDRYITAANGDDSGTATYSRTLPVASLRWTPMRDLALYVSAGRGFETPTLNELSYRSDGVGGLNFGLRPSVSDNVELGAKARLAGGLLTAALFQTRTQDEIVTDTNVGGRSTFRNAGRTERKGVEVGWQHETEDHWRTQVAYTWLDARYQDAFCTPSPCSAANLVPAGRRLPGVASQSLYAAYGWMPPQGWRAGAELRAVAKVWANDLNTARAPGYAVAAIHAGYVLKLGRWDLNAFARIDNLFDRRYAGSVIVNEGNARYFEPAPGRTWTVGMGGTYSF